MAPAVYLAKVGTDAAAAAGGGLSAATAADVVAGMSDAVTAANKIRNNFNQAVADSTRSANTPRPRCLRRCGGPRGAADGDRHAAGRPGTAAMIGRVLPRGDNRRGLLDYLYGKGKTSSPAPAATSRPPN
jgi:hypothetical protein